MTDLSDYRRILSHLDGVIASRKGADPSQSYVAKLLHKGPDAVLKKVAEEAGEVLLAAKDGQTQQIIYEVADLWFHTLVTLAQYNLTSDDILKELARREGLSGIAEKNARGVDPS